VVARSFVPVQTGPGAHCVSCTLGAGFLFRGKKLPRCGVKHPLPSSSEVKEKVVLYLCSPSGPSWPVLRPTLSLPWRLVTLKNMLFYSKVCDAFWPDFYIRDVTWTRTLCDELSFPSMLTVAAPPGLKKPTCLFYCRGNLSRHVHEDLKSREDSICVDV
jgi:hypothetical protein